MTRLSERTLEKKYQNKALREGRLLLEADQKKVQQIINALAALENITPAAATIFNQAVKNAKLELGKYLQGGIKQSFKNLFSDPVAKASTLAYAIRTGLSQLPTIAKLYLPPGSERETQKSIWEMVPVEDQKELLATFTKAFKTELSKTGAMELLKGQGLPYVNNLQVAVQELLQNTNPQGGFKLAQQAKAQQEPDVQSASGQDLETSSPTQQASATDQPQQSPTASGQQTKAPVAPTPPQTTAQSAETQSSTPETAATQTNTGKRLDPKLDAEKLKQLAYFVGSQAGVDAGTAEKIVNALSRIKAVSDVPLPQVPSKKLVSKPPAQ
jgi:hypothetical protein